MKRRCLPIFPLLLTIAAALLLSCVGTKGPPLESRFYTLEYPPPEPVTRDAPLSCILRVDSFDANPFFDTDRMAYREKPFQMAAYRYQRWQAPPALLVAWHLERDLQAARICRAVIGSDSLLSATHVLEGTVEQFFENDTADGWEAVLSVSLTLADADSSDSGKPRILLQRSYSVRHPSRYRNPESLAEAMSRAMAEVSRQALQDIYGALAQ